MLTSITEQTLAEIRNPDFRTYASQYLQIEKQTIALISDFGLAFETPSAQNLKSKEALKTQLRNAGATFSNNNKSIHINWRSSACHACQTGVDSLTTFLSLKCNRDCYFCFNPNQENYAGYKETKKDAFAEIQALAPQQALRLKHIALTGGEPLIYKKETIDFFQKSHQQIPLAHQRLYTAGDALDEATAIKLAQVGLNEIRFSIKADDPPGKQKKY